MPTIPPDQRHREQGKQNETITYFKWPLVDSLLYQYPSTPAFLCQSPGSNWEIWKSWRGEDSIIANGKFWMMSQRWSSRPGGRRNRSSESPPGSRALKARGPTWAQHQWGSQVGGSEWGEWRLPMELTHFKHRGYVSRQRSAEPFPGQTPRGCPQWTGGSGWREIVA